MENIFIDPKQSIKQALKQLDLCTEKVLLVVDEQKTLIGALTDGDMRRAILKGKALDAGIEGVYNKNPLFIRQSEFDQKVAAHQMLDSKIELIPIVNDDHVVVDYLNWSQALGGEQDIQVPQHDKIDIPVIIMAGGKGTRMAPFTHVLPKPLIPMGEDTILELIMHEFKRFGINNFLLTLNYKGEMIEAYFKSNPGSYRIQYLWEKEFFGTAGSLKLAQDLVKGDFMVSNCDVIVKADYSKVLDFHRQNRAALTIISSIQHYTIPYGVVRFKEGGEVEEITEKPEYTFPVNTGVYVLSEKCFSLIPDDKFYNMTDLIDDLLRKGEKVLTYPVNENDYIDIGQWEEYRSAIHKMRIFD